MLSSLQLMLPVKLCCMYSYMDKQMHPTECSPQLTPKLTAGRSTSAFSTYIRNSVRNTVACMFGSKTLCLFRHFYLLERRKILRRFSTITVCSHTLWVRLFRTDASPFKNITQLCSSAPCSHQHCTHHCRMWQS